MKALDKVDLIITPKVSYLQNSNSKTTRVEGKN